ncbi:MAG TPA: hypothetical protein VMN58_02050 [Acidimicrobiales bacterium]|nr:hypothetical protein [Acidimicrobiales bacterium]
MSRRHQNEDPGARPDKGDRQVGNRRVRREAKLALDGDPDGVVVPRSPVSAGRRASVGKPPAKEGSRRVRHWKQPFWKRRNNVRAQRAAAERDLASEV